MSAVTIEQIAQLASVSRSTVSRVLNNHPNVRAAVRDRILQVIDEHGYAPQAAARSLASQRTNVIGLLIPLNTDVVFSDPFFNHVIQGITEACNAHGYFLMLSMVTDDMKQSFYQRILRSRQFDGVILLSNHTDDPILPQLLKDQMPMVLVGRHPFIEDVSWVDVENREGARRAVTHLIELGHRRIGTITGSLNLVAAADRRDGYLQALADAELPVLPELIVEREFTHESGQAAMRQLLALAEPPTAVFVASDIMALGALSAIQEAGLRVPEDISIVGFDDLPATSSANPPLTTVHQPIYEMGLAAARLLIEQLDRRRQETAQVHMPAQLVVRHSSGALALHTPG
jgi:LacI family transcriptional regulator